MTCPFAFNASAPKAGRYPSTAFLFVGPGKWGNPFTVTDKQSPGTKVGGARGYIAVPTIADAVACFREMLQLRPDMLAAAVLELKGKDLACFCPLDQPCHADVLLEVANQ